MTRDKHQREQDRADLLAVLAESGPLGLNLPERACEAEWEFDFGFWVMCHDPHPDHDGDHHTTQPGNGGVVATITWSRPPATIDGQVVA